jgi:hypothetical protein
MESPYYFLIIDCEGNKANRCREIGILSIEITENNYVIFKEYINRKKENPMDMLKTAYGDIVQKNIKNGHKDRLIPIFTYGNYDEFLITRKLDSDKGKFRKTLKERFIFFDMQKIITNHLLDKKILIKRSKALSLSTVSKLMDTELITPCHNALSDSKTLNNIIIEYNKENNNVYNLIKDKVDNKSPK